MKNKIFKALNQYKAILLFLIITCLGSIMNPKFMTINNITNVLKQISSTGIATIGLTLVNITGGFDMSIGSTMALTGVVTMMFLDHGINLIVSMICGSMIGVLVGLINGLLIGRLEINPFIATLSTSTLVRGISTWNIGWPSNFRLE